MQQQGYIPETGQTGSSTVTSAAVDGPRVYSPSGDHLGSIDHLVIDKHSDNIACRIG